MSVYTVSRVIDNKPKTLYMNFPAKNAPSLPAFDPDLYSLFVAAADESKAFEIINKSKYLGASGQTVFSTFFSELSLLNKGKLREFSKEQKAKILYVNYRNRLLQKITTQPKFSEVLGELSTTFCGLNIDVNSALNSYLTHFFDNFHSTGPKLALSQLFNLENLEFFPSQTLPALSDKTRLEIPASILNKLWS
ncbi:MAG: hypothetical protein SNF33_02365 [Candidatus Algichlamydia australiensis]|nr:hypothetical protein [Chlamydiales bacterium]